MMTIISTQIICTSPAVVISLNPLVQYANLLLLCHMAGDLGLYVLYVSIVHSIIRPQAINLHISESVLLPSAVLSLINTGEPVPLAAMFAGTTTLPPQCLTDVSDHQLLLSSSSFFPNTWDQL